MLRSGRVRCWYEVEPWDDAAATSEVPGVEYATEVAVGAFGACAVVRGGTLSCWGAASLIPWAPYSSHRHAGYPKPTGATELTGIRDVVSVSLHDGTPCLLRRSGRVHCWNPEDAQTLLPDNPLGEHTEVRGLFDGVAVSANLVLRATGTVLEVVTSDMEGRLGLLAAFPFKAETLVNVVDLDGSPRRGCAVLQAGQVICWGEDMDRPHSGTTLHPLRR